MIHLKKHLHTLLIIGILGIMACTADAPKSVETIAQPNAITHSQNIAQSTQAVAESITAEVKEIVVDSIQKVVTKKADAPAKAQRQNPAPKPVIKKQVSKATAPAQKVAQKLVSAKKNPIAKSGTAIIQWEKTTHDFGMIKEGDVIETNFKFKNIGKTALVIKNATASCGCTQPSYPFIPIEPGEEGYIGVVYNSRTKIGPQKPYITITSNADKAVQNVYLKGYVEQVDTEQTTGKKEVQVIEAVPIKEGNN